MSSAAQSGTDSSLNLYFETNSAVLDSLQRTTLKNFLAAFPVVKSITGYADSTGQLSNNLRLSRKRAVAIYEVVKKEAGSVGPEGVFYKGETTEAPQRWKNRRVELIAASRPATKHLQPAPTADTVGVFDVNTIYFMPDKAIITQESLPYVQELFKNLRAYKTGTFEIIGHINYQSKRDSSHLQDLYRLSEQRARAVYDILYHIDLSGTVCEGNGL